MEIFKLFFFYLIISLLVGFTIYFGFKNQFKEMTRMVVLTIIVLFFLSIDKFEYFKGGGIEAKMRKAVTEAYATIENMKHLGYALSQPIVANISLQGRLFQYIPINQQAIYIEDVVKNLKEIGISEDSIKNITMGFRKLVLRDHVGKILDEVIKVKPNDQRLVDEFKKIFLADVTDWGKYDVNSADIRDFVKKHKIIGSEVENLILDLESYRKNWKLRRPEIWE
jgi:hypothetical protein